VEAARELRQHETVAEKRLWSFLRSGQIAGARVRRQHAIGPFVVDFYCPAVRVAIELDGSVHDDNDIAAQDAARTEWIEQHQIRVMRFRNDEIMNDISSVLSKIEQAITHPT
jgi:very-short-patch-repair endonuclease